MIFPTARADCGWRGCAKRWGCAYAMKPVSFSTDSAYRSLNPFGTVPFLQDGEISMSEFDRDVVLRRPAVWADRHVALER